MCPRISADDLSTTSNRTEVGDVCHVGQAFQPDDRQGPIHNGGSRSKGPSASRLNEFRDRHLDAFSELLAASIIDLDGDDVRFLVGPIL